MKHSARRRGLTKVITLLKTPPRRKHVRLRILEWGDKTPVETWEVLVMTMTPNITL